MTRQCELNSNKELIMDFTESYTVKKDTLIIHSHGRYLTAKKDLK